MHRLNETVSFSQPAPCPPVSDRQRGLTDAIRVLSQCDSTLLICGESGSGKEFVARQIHALSRRAAGPFVAVDCTTLSDTLFESQLFGHVRGAFTGADQATLGLFRAADTGVLLLDEVGDLPLPMQAKLLRCIQERAVLPVGGTNPIPADVRLIAATNRDLGHMVRQGTFREDLYFRIHVVKLDVPPLRERPAEIFRLAQEFLRAYAGRHAEPEKTLSLAAQQALRDYRWPGNIRELHNTLEHALVFAADDEIAVRDLPDFVRGGAAEGHGTTPPVSTLAQAERRLLQRALHAANGNQTTAAKMLGIERHRLARMLRRYELFDATEPPGPV